MRLFLIAIAAAFVFNSCQDYGQLEKRANLSRSLAEISGITKLPSSPLIFAIADHGNPNHIYAIDSTGFIQKEIVVANALNTDWEDLANDGKNRVFIGDFGNNDNDRRDLCIYSVNIPENIKEIDTVVATKTSFSLADQKEFPPSLYNRNYDIESFFFKDDSFYLFTRNRSRKEFDGTTKVYKVPARTGNFSVEPIISYTICDDPKDCFLTAATLGADNKTILLLTSNKVIKLSNYTGHDFFGGKIETIHLKYDSQKEGICMKDSSNVYIVDERRAQLGGNLYSLSLK